MFRRIVPAVIGGAVVLLVAACGSSSDNPTVAAPASSAPSSSANRAGGPAASGTVAALQQSSLEVQNQSSGQVTVNFSGDTTFTNRVSGTLADVAAGSCVMVTGTGQPLTAKTVEITPATNGGCTAGFGGGQRPQNGQGGQNGTASRSRPSRPSGTNRPGGANAGDFAFGKVSAVSATGFTVQQDNRQTGATTDVPVTVDSSTTYTKSEQANSSALKVGECVAATGQADDTGAVTAKTIAISQAGPNGCSVGGGRRPGGTNG